MQLFVGAYFYTNRLTPHKSNGNENINGIS